MNTEWKNYKSGRTGKVVGAYLYIPELTDKVIGHAFLANHDWYYHPYMEHCGSLPGSVPLGPFETLSEAKLHAGAAVAISLGGSEETVKLSPKVLQLNFDFAKAF